MPMQNDRPLSGGARQLFQPFAQINLLSGKEPVVETTNLSKRHGFAKNKRSRRILPQPADPIPKLSHQTGEEISAIQFNRAAAIEKIARLNRVRHLREEFRPRMRVRIHEHQPIAGSRLRPLIARPRNLVHRFKHHRRARHPRQFCGAVGGVVIANDQFALPAARLKSGHRLPNRSQACAEQLLLVKRRYDD